MPTHTKNKREYFFVDLKRGAMKWNL